MRVLVFGVEKWLGIARMPKLLRNAGFEVGVLCTEDTFLAATSHRDERFLLQAVDGPHVVAALNKAIGEWGAELIVPGDGIVLSILHQMVARGESGAPTGLLPAAVAAIERSLPPSRFFAATENKSAFLEMCRDLHVRTPEWHRAVTMADLLAFADEAGYPVVVKAEDTGRGAGVFVCESEDDLANAGYATLPQFTSHGRRQAGDPVTVERFIRGSIAQFVSVAWEGRVVAGTSAIKLHGNPEKTGPPTVIQFVDPGEAEELVGVLAAHAHFSGFATHDYVVEESTGLTYLTGCNPWPAAASAAAVHAGVDLGQALFAVVTHAPRQRYFLREGTVVALYPQEIIRDPKSEFLKTAIHDVPENDPELVAAYEKHVSELSAPA